GKPEFYRVCTGWHYKPPQYIVRAVDGRCIAVDGCGPPFGIVDFREHDKAFGGGVRFIPDIIRLEFSKRDGSCAVIAYCRNIEVGGVDDGLFTGVDGTGMGKFSGRGFGTYNLTDEPGGTVRRRVGENLVRTVSEILHVQHIDGAVLFRL